MIYTMITKISELEKYISLLPVVNRTKIISRQLILKTFVMKKHINFTYGIFKLALHF